MYRNINKESSSFFSSGNRILTNSNSTLSNTSNSSHGGVGVGGSSHAHTSSSVTAVAVPSLPSPTPIRIALTGLLKSKSEFEKHHGFLVEPSTHEKLLEKHAFAVKQLRVSDEQLNFILNESDQFHLLQQKLREERCQTEAYIAEVLTDMLRESLDLWQRKKEETEKQRNAELEQKRKQDRALQIQREMAEARIKAQLALGLTPTKKYADDDNDAESGNGNKNVSQKSAAAAASPTSVTNVIDFDVQAMPGAFRVQVDPVDCNADDDDVASVEG